MESCNLESVLRPSEDVVARLIEGELILVPLVAGVGDLNDELYALNEAAQAVWNRLDGVKTLGQVAAELAREFDASAGEIETDVVGLATELLQRGMLSVVCPP